MTEDQAHARDAALAASRSVHAARARMEHDLRAAHAQLRAQLTESMRREVLLATAIDSAPVAMLGLDAAGAVLLRNQRLEDLFARGDAGALRAAGDAEAVRARISAAVIDGPAFVRWFDAARADPHGAGAWTGCTAAGEPVVGRARRWVIPGKDDGCVLHWVDLGAGAELQALRAEAEAARMADRTKSAFMSRASHELRTPLNAVLGFATLLGELPALQVAGRAPVYVEHIANAGRHLLSLLDDLTQLSGLDSGQVTLRMERCELGELVESALKIVQPMADAHRIDLAWSRHRACWIEADPTRARQVLINLLSNAIKYNRHGGRVAVGLGWDPLRPEVEVADTGYGMSADQLAHLYEPFNRLGAERGSIQGTGLGMAITRALVERMGARLEIHSVPDVGTTVRVAWKPSVPPEA